MATSSTGVIWTTGAGFGLFGCATCCCWSEGAGLPPGGSQTVTTSITTISTVSITSIVVVMSCLFSKGMVNDKAKRALITRVMDNFMATDEKASDVDQLRLEDQSGTSVMSRRAIFLLRYWGGGERLREKRKVDARS